MLAFPDEKMSFLAIGQNQSTWPIKIVILKYWIVALIATSQVS